MQSFDTTTTPSSYLAVLTAHNMIDRLGKTISGLVEPIGPEQYRYGVVGVNKAMSYYYIDIVNFPESSNEIYDELIKLISTKSNLPSEQIQDLIKATTVPTTNVNPDVIVRFRIRGSMPVNVTIGRISFTLPYTIYERLMDSAKNDDQILTRFFIRYHLMGPLDGMFWSMDKRIYELMNKTPLPVLEGFASPLNWNLPNYCSAFNEDVTMGSKGNFFNYISILNAKARIVVNPPYTERIMNKAIDLSLKYVKRSKGEVILMLPHWKDLKGIIKLKKNKNVASHVFEAKTHLLHNYSTDEVMMIPTPLIFMVITSRANTSKKILTSIKDKMAEIVQEFNTQ